MIKQIYSNIPVKKELTGKNTTSTPVQAFHRVQADNSLHHFVKL